MSAVTFAITAVLNRSLKGIPSPIIVFYFASGGVILASIFIFIETMVTGDSLRFFDYTARQYGIASAAALLETLAVFGFVISCQYDSS